MDERGTWERRFMNAQGSFYGRAPSPFLLRSLPFLPLRGHCLDLGGGQGRNAAFLTARGWRVTMVDIALAGTAAARWAALQTGGQLLPVVADLEASPLRLAPGSIDLLMLINYHNRDLIAQAHEWLRPGGALLVEGFSIDQLGRPSGGPHDAAVMWRPNELLNLAGGLRIVSYEDRLTAEDDNPRHLGERWVVRLLALREA